MFVFSFLKQCDSLEVSVPENENRGWCKLIGWQSKPERGASVMSSLRFPPFTEQQPGSPLGWLAGDFSVARSHRLLQSPALSGASSWRGRGDGRCRSGVGVQAAEESQARVGQRVLPAVLGLLQLPQPQLLHGSLAGVLHYLRLI